MQNRPNRPGRGRRQNPRNNQGRSNNRPGKGQAGSATCTCPDCDYSKPHVRGIPCSQEKCPNCNTPLRGAFCR